RRDPPLNGGRRGDRHGRPGVRAPRPDHARDPARRPPEVVVMDGYLAFLIARDGEPDLLRHTLSRREAFFDRLAREPVPRRLRVDRETFLRNRTRRRRAPGLDECLLCLRATAKANQAERFGVGLGELYGRVDPRDPLKVHIALQEHYHTRLLADVVTM